MKKAYFIPLALVLVIIMAVSCTGTPKSQKTEDSVPETPAIEAVSPPEQESVSDISEETGDALADALVDEEDTDTVTIEEIIEDTPADEEPVLAEEEPPAAAVEPEPPVLAAVPEPEPLPQTPPPAAEPPPPVQPAPRQEQPPRVTAPTPAGPPARPPARPPTGGPPTPAPVAPPAEETKPAGAEEPPAIVREPLRDGPELPNPTPGISGRHDAPVVFSRVVRAIAGQLVEVPFRGTGWVYLGETGAQRGIAYDSRRLDPEGQSFIFRTERAGEYALKFYRQDFIRDFIINDYVQVLVGAPSEAAGSGWFSPPVDRGRVIAEPRWPSPLAEAQALRAGNPSQSDISVRPPTGSPAQAETTTPPQVTPQTAPPAASPTTPSALPRTPLASPPQVASPAAPPPAAPRTPSAPPPQALPDESQNTAGELPVYLDPAMYLEKAKEEFAAGRIAPAISFLDRFCEYYPAGSDEAWWLYGQFYEANSPSRNILAALNCYRRLVEDYPQSSRYDDARKRIAYLQRYYININ